MALPPSSRLWRSGGIGTIASRRGFCSHLALDRFSPCSPRPARGGADLRSPTEPAATAASQTAIAATALWVVAALAFGGFLLYRFGPGAAVQYLAGYSLEESLSIDNLFVFLLLFRLFAIERPRQPKVLFWGVAGAIFMRGLFLAGGLTLLDRFAPVDYVFGALFSSQPSASSSAITTSANHPRPPKNRDGLLGSSAFTP